MKAAGLVRQAQQCRTFHLNGLCLLGLLFIGTAGENLWPETEEDAAKGADAMSY